MLGEVDLALLAAEHLLQALRRVVAARRGVRQQHLGVFHRILHAHAAVAVGSLVVREVVLLRCVVLVDEVFVREIEPDAAERIALGRAAGIRAPRRSACAQRRDPCGRRYWDRSLVERQQFVVDD